MKKSIAKTLFFEGVLIEALATKDQVSGFNLAFKKQNSGNIDYLVTERGGIRQFKTADAVIKTAKEIGFQIVEFHV